MQGALGDCWFMSAASAIAELPGRMEEVFLNQIDDNSLNKAGVYAMNLYTLGVPHTVVVDDYLPLMPIRSKPKPSNDDPLKKKAETEVQPEQKRTLFAKAGSDGSLWGAFLEKAFAKHHGNFKHIEGGDPRKAVGTLYGSPYATYTHDDRTILEMLMMKKEKISDAAIDELWDQLWEHDQNDDIITAGTPGESDSHFDENGLA